MSSLPFFDVNCLVGRLSRPGPNTLQEPADVLAELHRHGVHEALIADTRAVERDLSGNFAVLDVVAANPGTHPVWVMPQHTVVDIPHADAFVADVLGHGVRALRVAPSPYHGHLVAPWALGPAWRAVEEARLPVLLSDTDLGRYPDKPSVGFSVQNVFDLCQAYPELPIIVLRTNFSATRVLVPLLRECPNLHVEVSYYTAHRGFEFLAQQVGAERLVFGTGLPVGSAGPAVLGTTFARLGDEQKALIAGDNLRRLLAATRR